MDRKRIASRLEARMAGFGDVGAMVEALANGRIGPDDALDAWTASLDAAWSVRNDTRLHVALMTEQTRGVGPMLMIDAQQMRASIEAARTAFHAEMPRRLEAVVRETARALNGESDSLDAALRAIPVEPKEIVALVPKAPTPQNDALSGLNAMVGRMLSLFESRPPAGDPGPAPTATLPHAIARIVVEGGTIVAVDEKGSAVRLENGVARPTDAPNARPAAKLGMKEPDNNPVRAWVPLDEGRVLAVGGDDDDCGGWVAVGERATSRWTFLDDYDAACRSIASRGTRHIIGMSDGTALLFDGDDGELGLVGGCDVAMGEAVTAIAWLDDDHIVGGTDRGKVVVAEVLG